MGKEVGVFHEEQFDKEELAALGEAEGTVTDPVVKETVPKEGPEPKEEPKETPKEEPKEEPKTEPKAEPTAEEQAAAKEQGFRVETDEKGHTYIIDEDGTKIPPKRFKEIYFEAQEGRRSTEKLKLLKELGPDEYYRVYPEEAPSTYRPPHERVDPLSLVAGRTNPAVPYQYEGMTLRDIMKADPDEGARLLESWREGQKTEVDTKTREIQETVAEADEFAAAVAKEIFNRDSLKALTPEEEKAINDLIPEVYKWGVDNGKSKYRLVDVWRLKNKADPVKQEKALKSLEVKPAVKSIGSGGGSAGLTGFEAYEAMSESELTDKIDAMKDKELREFYKKAPQSLRKKYPSIPWD